MMFTRLRHTLSILAAISTVFFSPLPAAAGAFNVNPIRVFLNKDTNSTVLTIENQDTKVLRLQIRAYSWTNDRSGQPILKPTDDLIVFPTLVDISPAGFRSIRIGFSGTSSDKELDYRIALDEMPSLESQLAKSRAPGLRVRTRITVPVFIAPMTSVPKAQIKELAISRGTVHGTFSNQGNLHATVSTVDVVGHDAAGVKVFEKKISGWYVLPGQEWDFQTALGSACSKVKTVSVTVQSDLGRFSETANAASPNCR